MAIKTAKELAAMCEKVATEYKTLYVTGCFGAPLNEKNKQRWMAEYEANRKEPRKTNIMNASADTFGFDCVNLIKALLWGWTGDVNANYGGAVYQSNGVPDIDESAMFARCTEQSTDFSYVEVGEAVWMKGHIGIYIGDGLAVECTPAWTNNVQITSCNCSKTGYNRRNWTKHGKLPYVEYTKQDEKPSNAPMVGDIVTFTGGKHYVSAWSNDGVERKPGKAKVTAVAMNGVHQYHLVAVTGGGSNVYGWVDAKTITTISAEQPKPVSPAAPTIPVVIKKGDVVSIAKNATYYTGKDVPDWVVEKQWIVSDTPVGDRVVINKSVDGKHAISSPIHAKFLTVVGVDEPWTPKVGDIVSYNGNKHYTSADAANGSACKGGLAKITNIYQLGKSKHPYHLVRVSGKGATVYGWVDEGSFTKA